MRNAKGFTLVELMTVVLIMGILINISLPNYAAFRKKAQAARVVSDFLIIRDAATLHHAEHGAWPEDSGMGEVPQSLREYLPRDFAWDLEPDLSITYKWESFGGDGQGKGKGKGKAKGHAKGKGKAKGKGQGQAGEDGGLVGVSVTSQDIGLLKAIAGVHRGPVWPSKVLAGATAITLIVEGDG
jgi:prepilin-type N-terminal cleavage/methylation domain-containing protein